jgi:hypothetical protein
VANGIVSTLTTQTNGGPLQASTAPVVAADANSTVIPALDQTQAIVSPSRN